MFGSLGNILAVTLPLLAVATGGGGATATAGPKAAKRKGGSDSFLGGAAGAAEAFLKLSGTDKSGQPFAYRSPADTRARSISELTRGNPTSSGPLSMTGPQFNPYASPIMNSVLERLQYARNDTVNSLFKEYKVLPTIKGKSPTSIKQTEVNVRRNVRP